MKMTRIILVLAVTAGLSGGLLSLADIAAKDRILENQKQAIKQGIRTIASQAAGITEVEKDLYKIFNEKEEFLGYMFLAEGQGYAGPIKILCGVDADVSRIIGIEIIESIETPGLGARINEDDFKGQFRGLDAKKKMECVKRDARGNDIQAITGATISSRSVVKILNGAIEELRKKIR